MYFDFEDYRPDVSPVGRAISWREGVLISIFMHVALIALTLTWPRLFPYDPAAARALELARAELPEERTQFVFVEPRIDTPAPRPPNRAEASDQDRMARAPERSPELENPLPFSRGNTPERVDSAPPAPRGDGPESQEPEQAEADREPQEELKLPEAQAALRLPPELSSERPLGQRETRAGGTLGDALRNLQRYVEAGQSAGQFDNPQGGGGAFGPAIQFDTKGVEFGPWIRRFVAQVKGNWMIPYATLLSERGHVVITFNVHKNGALTDLTVVGPSEVDAFNNAAFGALAASNPTHPLPPEYPADRAFFTVTFFYNETPP
jgi:TonB family protein